MPGVDNLEVREATTALSLHPRLVGGSPLSRLSTQSVLDGPVLLEHHCCTKFGLAASADMDQSLALAAPAVAWQGAAGATIAPLPARTEWQESVLTWMLLHKYAQWSFL